MMEINNKEKFILLSKVAREKKYAQEYLGLLARRGDLGSIRIGKRWYTTEEWFDEFLKDAEKRKTEAKVFEPASQAFQVSLREERKETVGSKLPGEQIIFPKIISKPQFASVAGKNFGVINLREIMSYPASRPVLHETVTSFSQKDFEKKLGSKNQGTTVVKLRHSAKKAPVRVKSRESFKTRDEEREQTVIFRSEEEKSNFFSKEFSPEFAPIEAKTPFFPKFAFSMSLVLILFLLIQAGWVYRNDLIKIIGIQSGKVAGVQDNSIDLAVLKISLYDYMKKQGDGVREDLSLSRVLVRAALEKENLKAMGENVQ